MDLLALEKEVLERDDDARSTTTASTSLGFDSEANEAAEDANSAMSWCDTDEMDSASFHSAQAPALLAMPGAARMPLEIQRALAARKAALGAQVAELAEAALRAERPEKAASRCAANRSASSAANVVEARPVEKTTLILRHLPAQCSRARLLELLDSEGFAGEYNFVYVPIDFDSGSSFGYAFVNLESHQSALRAIDCFNGRALGAPGAACEAGWSEPHQGLVSYVERYRNSPVMHPSVPEEHRPMLFRSGRRCAFPAPTRRLKAPRARRSWRGIGASM